MLLFLVPKIWRGHFICRNFKKCIEFPVVMNKKYPSVKNYLIALYRDSQPSCILSSSSNVLAISFLFALLNIFEIAFEPGHCHAYSAKCVFSFLIFSRLSLTFSAFSNILLVSASFLFLFSILFFTFFLPHEKIVVGEVSKSSPKTDLCFYLLFTTWLQVIDIRKTFSSSRIT